MAAPPQQPPMYRHATRSEIIELAALEGHDADIPTNAGSIHQVASRTSARASSPGGHEEKDKPAVAEKDVEKDVEKGTSTESTASVEDSDGESADPNVVDFDGPDDPENPLNWKASKKWGTVSLVSALTFITPLASSIFAPGVPEVMQEFKSTNDMLEGFMISVYVLGFAFGPLIIAPLSEMYGRLPLYHSCNFLFIVFTIAAAVATNMGQFITFRFFMGTFGGAPMVLGGGTIADLIPREQRGTAMAVWMMGPTIGPCVGPMIGGFLTAAKGWRWNFWLVAITAGAFFVMSMITMRETSGIKILERKTKRLRAETGNDKLVSKLDSGLTPKELFKFSIVRPMKMLFCSTICASISLYIAVTYAYLYILFTTFTSVYKNQYHWSGGVLGLSFLGIGIGQLLAQFVGMHFGNKIAAKHIKKGDFQPEHRLQIMCIGGFIMPIGFFIYGWCVEKQTHFIVPLIATGFIGFGLLLTFMPASTYLVDVFTVHAASAMAASTVSRSLCAAFIPLSSQKMYAKLGYGWGNTMLGIIACLLIPIPFLFIRYGERIRANSTVKL